MKRISLALLCVLLLSLITGCGSGAPASDPGSATYSVSHSTASQPASTSVDLSTLAGYPVELGSDGAVVTSQSSFYAPYCLSPAQDGTYHFSALTADYFVGTDCAYDGDTITWTVYVTDEIYVDDWTQLPDVAQPAILDLNSSVDIALKEGQYIYCVPSLNVTTGKAAADDSGTLTITMVEQDFVPDQDNNYHLAITTNSETHFDLNGDGTEDSICYSIQPSALVNNAWTEAKLSLVINDVSYLDSLLENGFYLENPEVPYYYLVDLNKGDPYCEVAIADWGNNDWLSTHYFRYTGDALLYLGSIPQFPDSHSTVFFGDGRVSALTMLNVMQTWRGQLTYQLQGDSIVCLENQFCQPVCDGIAVTLLQDILVHTEPDLSSDTLTLTASAAVLSFPSTDGIHWVEILCADGTTGWAYFSDFSTLVSGEETYQVWDIFDGLFLAG